MATAILIIIEGQFQVFRRFSSSKLVLKSVGSRFTTLNYYENGSNKRTIAPPSYGPVQNTCIRAQRQINCEKACCKHAKGNMKIDASMQTKNWGRQGEYSTQLSNESREVSQGSFYEISL